MDFTIHIKLSLLRDVVLLAFGLVLISQERLMAQEPISLSFTDMFHIDDSQITLRDRSKPFYFDLGTPFGTTYPFTADIGSDFRVWFDKQVPVSIGANRRSLGMALFSDHDENKKDKIVFSIFRSSAPRHIEVDESNSAHFLSFDFMLDADYQVPDYWLIHLQAWQCCGGNPPFDVAVVPGKNPSGPVEFLFGVRNDATMRLPGHPEVNVYKMSVPRGRWFHMSLKLQPSIDSNPAGGNVEMWFDGGKRFDYHGHWGYDPAQRSFEGHAVDGRIGIDLGIYRRRQRTMQTIYFDNIRYGDDLSSITR